jgi:hypothetical protein
MVASEEGFAMSFRIFAAGSGFHFVKDSLEDGSSFDLMKTISILSTMEPSGTGVATALVDKLFQSAGVPELVEAIATMELLQSLCDAVDLLSIKAGDGAFISVFAKKRRLILSDVTTFSNYQFSPGDSPGKEFIQHIGKGLEKTDLGNWGVLAALVVVMAKYSDFISDKDVPVMLHFELTKK